MKTPLLFFAMLMTQICFGQLTQSVKYATYVGGQNDDFACNLQIADNDDIFLAISATGGCVTTPGVHQTAYSGGISDVLIQKRDKNATLIWSTYFGGGAEDIVNKVILLKSGKIAVVGQTTSTTNIAKNGFQMFYGGGSYDGFLAVFNEDGTLDWSTYLGDVGEDVIYGINDDSEGNLYISGYTYSPSKIATLGCYQFIYGGNGDGFLAKVSAGGQLIWSTYIGGPALDAIYAMDIDSAGNIWFGGKSYSTSGLVTNNAYKTQYSGRGDALLMSFDKDGKKLYGTYYGGVDTDEIYVLNIDNSGNIWFAGPTKSATNIATPGAISELRSGSTDVFIAKFNNDRKREWATYLGGNQWETIFGMDIDKDGNAILNMMTQSNDFYPIKDAMQATFGGGPWDAVYAKIDGNGKLVWSTYHGGINNDRGIDVKVNSEGDLIFFTTVGSQGMHTDDADDKTLNGSQDGLLLIIKEEEISSVHNTIPNQTKMTFYPNPVHESLVLDLENSEDYYLEVYDGFGNKMNLDFQSNRQTETSHLPSGLYYVKATHRHSQSTIFGTFIKI